MNLTRDINPEQKDMDAWVDLGNGRWAQRYDILCTLTVAYEVWEKLAGHSTQTSHDRLQLGSMTSRPLPPELEALPGWTPGFWPVERIAKVDAYLDDLKRQADALIRQTFPQDLQEVAA